MERTLFKVVTRGRGFYELTGQVQEFVAGSGIVDGFCQLFIRHTSASLVITENADHSVHEDLEAIFSKLVPEDAERYRHRAEGEDDMPAHIRSVITQPSLLVPVTDTRCMLGTWQGMFLWEHRRRTHERQIVVTAWTL